MKKAPPDAPLSHPDFGRIVPCPACRGPEIEARAIARALVNAGIPVVFADKDFESYRRQPAADLDACEWVEEFAARALAGETGSLLLTGPVGTRKTGLAVSAFRVMTQSSKFRPAAFVRPVDLFRHLGWAMGLEKAGGTPDPSPAEQIDYLCRVPLLLFDDLCAERWTEYREEKMYEIIGARYDRRLTTIFTSNVNVEMLDDYLGLRARSRVIEMCAGNVIAMVGDDRRVIGLLGG